MTNQFLTQLDPLTTPNDDMEFLVDVGGVSKRITHLNFKLTPSEILTKIKTVDGVGSGLDADTLQAVTPSNLSLDGGYF
jgi:hypothetical protein